VKGPIVGLRRRIEITVYRRSIIILHDRPDERPDNCVPVEAERSEQIRALFPQVREFDQDEAHHTIVDVASSPEFTVPIEALVKSDSNRTSAPRESCLRFRNIISKLRGLGLANKQ